LLLPAVDRAGDDGILLVRHAMHDDLALALELPHRVAHVLDAVLLREHRALVDALLDPGGRDARLLGEELRVLPLGTMAGEAFAAVLAHSFSSCASRKSCQSSRFSSIDRKSV